MRLPLSLPMLCLLAAAGLRATNVGAADPASEWKVARQRSGDDVAIELKADVAIVTVRSAKGIGEATIERSGTRRPKSMILRLHLNGLESLRVTTGTTTLNVAVSSQAAKRDVRVWSGDREDAPLTEKDPLWTDVRLLDARGRPTNKIPLAGGCIELTLPTALFADDPRSITFRWIDFYRN